MKIGVYKIHGQINKRSFIGFLDGEELQNYFNLYKLVYAYKASDGFILYFGGLR